MVHYLALDEVRLAGNPLILMVPGLDNSGAGHWQTLWEAQCSECRRVDLGMWNDPHRNTWVNKLNLAIHRAERPIILVAHSLGCLAVSWWAQFEQPSEGNPVVGALLVAPPEVDRPGIDPRLARFRSGARSALPFRSILAASEDDGLCGLDAAAELASEWGSRFVNAGAVGHINARSGLGDWAVGKSLLAELLAAHRREHGHGDRGGSPILSAARDGAAGAQRGAGSVPGAPVQSPPLGGPRLPLGDGRR